MTCGQGIKKIYSLSRNVRAGAFYKGSGNIKKVERMIKMFKQLNNGKVIDLERYKSDKMKQLNNNKVVDLERYKSDTMKQFLYDIGQEVILRYEIKVGTYCGGVEFSNTHKKAETQTLTITDQIIDEFGNYYITKELGAEEPITDTMIDQLKTKAHHQWKKKRPLICIIGRTASGKDTFASSLVDEHTSLIKSYTTRPRREGEGDTHIFIDSIEGYKDRWVESEINGYNYFVLEEDIVNNDILIVDPVGFYSLVNQPEFARDVEVYYLMVDPMTRLTRYTARDKSTVEDFIERDGSENKQFAKFEKSLQNEHFRDKYNIRVFTSETKGQEPFYRELLWDGPYCGQRHTGGWLVDNSKLRDTNLIEEVKLNRRGQDE